ncbi:MAG: 3-phosphoshikimate 1-carboxyvinyltransferase [Anaerolineae bacterium]|nr:3-phosphoshikimate 1-carboxyvinyltransferase [Anaerolineae bacterium]
MSQLTVRPSASLQGSVRVPGDKSISHRAVMFGALAEGGSRIEGFLSSGDCLATLGCLRALGVEIASSPPQREGWGGGQATTLTVHGRGLHGLQAPGEPLNCVRSGTTMRLLAGILAGQPFDCTLAGDPQLLRRPMRRIAEPLRAMGAEIEDTDGRAPLAIRGRKLRGYDHTLVVASAQVKSALLLAGLYADGPTVVRQPDPARDHTERMLMAMGAKIAIDGLDITLTPVDVLTPNSLTVPGDISSAAFLLVAAALVEGSEVMIEGVGVNPTRTGLLGVLGEMGARIDIENARVRGGEPVADLTVRFSSLRGVEVGGSTVVRMIDEFPILAVAATQASGTTVVRDAAELRVKETDRIAVIAEGLQAMGARIEPQPDGFIVEGPLPLQGAVVNSYGDHRLAMALAVAGMIAEGETVVENSECIADSFPGFMALMQSLESAG